MKTLFITLLLLSSVYCASFYSADLGSKKFAIGSVTNGKVDLVLNEQSKRLTSTLARYVDGVYSYGDPVQQSKRAQSFTEFLPWNANSNISLTTDFLTSISEKLPPRSEITLVVPPTITEEQLHDLAIAIEASDLTVSEVTYTPLMVALNYAMYHTQQLSNVTTELQILDVGHTASHLATVEVSYSNFNLMLNMTSVQPFNFTGKGLSNLISSKYPNCDAEKMKKSLTNSNTYTEVSENGIVTKVTATAYNELILPAFSVLEDLNTTMPMIITGGASRTRGFKTFLIEKGFTLYNVNVEEAGALGGALYAAKSISRIKPTVFPKIALPTINSTDVSSLKNFTHEASHARKTLRNYHTIINTVENVTASTGDEKLTIVLDDVTSSWCYDVDCMASAITKLEEAVQEYLARLKPEDPVEEDIIEHNETIHDTEPVFKEDL